MVNYNFLIMKLLFFLNGKFKKNFNNKFLKDKLLPQEIMTLLINKDINYPIINRIIYFITE